MLQLTENEYRSSISRGLQTEIEDELRSFLDSGADYAELKVFREDNPYGDRTAYINAASRLWRHEKYFDARRLKLTVRRGRIFVKIDRTKEVR